MKKRVSSGKMYIVRKYVKANSVVDALRKERSIKPHEVFVDEEWKKDNLAPAIGFSVKTKRDDD